MSSPNPFAGLKPCTLSVALALCGASIAAQAATITLSADYSLGSRAGGVNGLTDPDAFFSGDGPSAYPTATGSDFYLTKNDAMGNNVFFHTYGFVSSPTYFGARSSGEGTWYASSVSNFKTTFTNNGTAILPLSLSFNVDGGDVGLYGSGEGFAQLALRVMVNGSDVARDQVTIEQTATGTTCTEDDVGTSLAAYMSCGSPTANSVFASGGLFTVFLGNIDVGQTIAIDYDIISTTSGEAMTGAVDCNYNEEGYGGYEQVERTAAFEGPYYCPRFNGIARSGDPFNLPITDGAPQVNFDPRLNVPTPGTLALFAAAAVAGLAAQRRRRAPGRHG
ncbi:MAG: hypothetical protein JNM08_06195 [Rubrivivax sp.]|nr:hypothetical protein [Rubrivivax sp.]